MMSNIISYGITVILIYYFAYFGARVLSKKAVSEMTAYEMVGVIIMATVAAEPLVTKITTQALTGTAILLILTFVTSKIALNNKFTRYLEHTPSILVKDGKIEWAALKANSLSINMFYGLLRQRGYNTVGDLEYVILEPEGKLSAFPKSQKRPVQPSDLNIPTSYEGIAYPLIIDGTILQDSLDFVNLSEVWLAGELKKQGIKDRRNISLAELDSSGNLLVSLKK